MQPRPRRPLGPAVAPAVAVARRTQARVARYVGPHRSLALLLAAALVLALAATAATAQLYEAVTEREGIAGLDGPVSRAIVSLRTPAMDTWVIRYTDLGGPATMPWLTLAVTVVVAAWLRSRRPLLITAMASGGSLAMTVVGKAVVDRVRPPLSLAVPPYETTPSFPSGHALNSWVVAGALVYLVLPHLHRRWLRGLVLATGMTFAVAMGLSRVYLGHHWLTDVLVAWTLGTGWLAVVGVADQLVGWRGRDRVDASAAA